MRSRPFIVFWGAVAGAVLFLGASWATIGRVLDPTRGPLDTAVLVIAIIGLGATGFVAGRIALVTARAQRRARHLRPAGPGAKRPHVRRPVGRA